MQGVGDETGELSDAQVEISVFRLHIVFVAGSLPVVSHVIEFLPLVQLSQSHVSLCPYMILSSIGHIY